MNVTLDLVRRLHRVFVKRKRKSYDFEYFIRQYLIKKEED
jgi:hypothetical protein